MLSFKSLGFGSLLKVNSTSEVEKCQSSHLYQQVNWKPVVRYSKKHGRCCLGHNADYLTCQSGSLGSFSCKVGLAKQRTDFAVRTRPSFEFFSEAWQALWASVLLAAAENKRWFLGAGVWVEKDLRWGLLGFKSVEIFGYPDLLQGHDHLCFLFI